MTISKSWLKFSQKNLRLIFDRKFKNHKPTNEIELFKILNDCQQQLAHDFYQSLVESMIRHSQTITDVHGGARGVMVIVIGNGHGDMSSNPSRDWLHFT